MLIGIVIICVLYSATAAGTNSDADACARDALYKVIVQNMARAKNHLKVVRDKYANQTHGGKYWKIVHDSAATGDIQRQLGAGNVSFVGDDCVAVAARLLRNIDQSILHAHDPIPGRPPYTGEAELQEAYQALGQGYLDMIRVANTTFDPTTKYQSVIRLRGDDINGPFGHRFIVKQGANVTDHGQHCMEYLRVGVAGDGTNQQYSLTDNSTDCSLASFLPRPYVPLPPHTCKITPIGCID